MKQIQMTILRRRGVSNLAGKPRATSFLLGAFLPCLVSAHAAEALPAQAPERQSTQVQAPAYVPQGAQMERYKAFARQAELPLITVTNNSVIEVGRAVKLNVTRLSQSTSEEQAALAGQFGVPAGVIRKLMQRVADGAPPDADQLIQELRRAVIDYRFLQLEWERYNPPAAGALAKRDAMAALQAGDLNKAWRLYDGLRKPQAPALGAPAPPTNLRVVAGP